MIINRTIFGILILASFFSFLTAQAAPPPDMGLKDTGALRDLTVAKGVFLLNVKEPGRMAHVLKVIEETAQGVAAQKVKPETIVVVIGPSVAFLTKDRRGIPYTEQKAVADVHGFLVKLKKAGVRTEVCGIAMRNMDVTPEMLVSEATAVGNGYVSAIGYQSQGYSLVPVF